MRSDYQIKSDPTLLSMHTVSASKTKHSLGSNQKVHIDIQYKDKLMYIMYNEPMGSDSRKGCYSDICKINKRIY